MSDLRSIIENWYESLKYYVREDTTHKIEAQPYRLEEDEKAEIREIRAEERYILEGFEKEWRAIREDLDALKKDWSDL